MGCSHGAAPATREQGKDESGFLGNSGSRGAVPATRKQEPGEEEEHDTTDAEQMGNLFGPVKLMPRGEAEADRNQEAAAARNSQPFDFQSLLGERAKAPPAGSDRSSVSSLPGDAPGAATARRHSAAAMRHAAKSGVPLPGDDGDYTPADAYIDGLFGTPDDKRPDNWRQPSMDDVEASLRARQHDILHADGNKAPASLEQRPQGREGSNQPVEVVNSILQGWKDIDSHALQAPGDVGTTVPVAPAAGPGPMPKRRAAPAAQSS